MQLRRIPGWCLVAFAAVFLAGRANAQQLPDDRGIRKMLLLPAEKINLLEVKLAVDKVIDPSIDVAAIRKLFEIMVSDIQRNQRPNMTSIEKLQAIRLYLYGKGPWNKFQTY